MPFAIQHFHRFFISIKYLNTCLLNRIRWLINTTKLYDRTEYIYKSWFLHVVYIVVKKLPTYQTYFYINIPTYLVHRKGFAITCTRIRPVYFIQPKIEFPDLDKAENELHLVLELCRGVASYRPCMPWSTHFFRKSKKIKMPTNVIAIGGEGVVVNGKPETRIDSNWFVGI